MILILDFGSQYTQLIARRLRELEVYAEILPHSAPAARVLAAAPAGIILSGGPASVGRGAGPSLDPAILEAGIPVLGICYGMQLLVHMHGGRVAAAPRREYGRASIALLGRDPLFAGLGRELEAWMSHGDGARSLGNGFKVIARTAAAPFAAIADPARRWYGVQFHPEVAHTPRGALVLENFARRICGVAARWTMGAFQHEAVRRIRETVGEDDRVVLALSGGVDSSVTAALLERAVGRRLHAVHVDTGLGREGDVAALRAAFRGSLRLKVVDASDLFLRRLAGVADPERKRKIIGRTFIRVFEREAGRIRGARFLAQGTLYPDVIESASVHGPSAVIKSHHNVGGLPKRMRLRLLEPLRSLFKDEVRKLGRSLGLAGELLDRHPFPGPGLAVRVIGPVTRERVELLRKADSIVTAELRASGWHGKAWQAFPVLLPVRSVGVMGDARTHDRVIALRAVASVDGMTADWVRLPHEVLARVSSRIVSEVGGVNRVVYDITSKPPATIEWE